MKELQAAAFYLVVMWVVMYTLSVAVALVVIVLMALAVALSIWGAALRRWGERLQDRLLHTLRKEKYAWAGIPIADLADSVLAQVS